MDITCLSIRTLWRTILTLLAILFVSITACAQTNGNKPPSVPPIFVSLTNGGTILLTSWERLEDGSVVGKGVVKTPTGAEFTWIPFKGTIGHDSISFISENERDLDTLRWDQRDASSTVVDRSLIMIHAEVLWSPSVKMNFPIPANTVVFGIQTGTLPMEVGVEVMYTMGSFFVTARSDGLPDPANISIENGNQLAFLITAGVHSRDRLLSYDVEALAGSITTTQRTFGTSVGSSFGSLPLSIDERANVTVRAFGIRGCIAMRVNQEASLGIGGRILHSSLGTLTSFGLVVLSDI